MRRRRRITITLAAAWLVALVIVVAVALGTRPDDVGTNDGAGIALAVFTLPAIALGAWQLRQPVVALITIGVGAVATCLLAWSVLFDDSSTAALGVLAIAFYSLVIVGVGVGADKIVGAVRSH